MTRPIIYLNSHRAKSGEVDDHSISKGHVFLARFFGVGPIDRTGTLTSGFPCKILSEIPTASTDSDFPTICAEVAHALLDRAIRDDVGVQITWSGGIDSTVALLALREAAQNRGELQRLEIRYTIGSIAEYPLFFEEFIFKKLRARPADHPLPTILDGKQLTITGELGDQLFGSDYLAEVVRSGLGQTRYERVLPALMTRKLGRETRARFLLDYLRPQIAAAPVPIRTAFDYIWWLNFSLKWQMVSLRLPAFTALNSSVTDVQAVAATTIPFFADARFQSWSLSNPRLRATTDWRKYKLEAKKFILQHTDDFDYYTTKEKQPSLKSVIVNRSQQGQERYRLFIRDDYSVELERFQRREA